MQENAASNQRGTSPDCGGNRFSDATLSTSRLCEGDQRLVSSWMKNPKGFLIFMGCPGSGKTHFCHAIMNDMKDPHPHFYKRFWSESSFTSQIKSSFDLNGTSEQEIIRLGDDHLVILDDLGSTQVSEWKKEILLQFINHRYEKRLPTVVTSNLNEHEIKEILGERIHSRLFEKESVVLDFAEVDWRGVDIKDRPS